MNQSKLAQSMSKNGNVSTAKMMEPMLEPANSLTMEFDHLFRIFTYNYPSKNKQEIINKSLTAFTFWLILDSTYFPENVDFQIEKINTYRKKSELNKNGSFPPTKDYLEEEKFILKLRNWVSSQKGTHNISDILETSAFEVIAALENAIAEREYKTQKSIEAIMMKLENDSKADRSNLERLRIPVMNSSKLFRYEQFENQIIENLSFKSESRQLMLKCELCFLPEQTIKCKMCLFNVHPACHPRLIKDPLLSSSFLCDNCEKGIPGDAQCILCPCRGGYCFQTEEQCFISSYQISKGESALKFSIDKHYGNQKQKQFIHLSCFVLHSELTYNPTSTLVEGLHYIDRKRKQNICSICGNTIGLTISCHSEGCRRSFHPECARRNNLNINVIKAHNKALLEIYCERHKRSEPHEVFKDSTLTKMKELKKFYENLDHEVKRGNHSHHSLKMKKNTRLDDYLKQDQCLGCGRENEQGLKIKNCTRCYGWRHLSCCQFCPYCDI